MLSKRRKIPEKRNLDDELMKKKKLRQLKPGKRDTHEEERLSQREKSSISVSNVGKSHKHPNRKPRNVIEEENNLQLISSLPPSNKKPNGGSVSLTTQNNGAKTRIAKKDLEKLRWSKSGSDSEHDGKKNVQKSDSISKIPIKKKAQPPKNLPQIISFKIPLPPANFDEFSSYPSTPPGPFS